MNCFWNGNIEYRKYNSENPTRKWTNINDDEKPLNQTDILFSDTNLNKRNFFVISEKKW